jgi:hypothetical protein
MVLSGEIMVLSADIMVLSADIMLLLAEITVLSADNQCCGSKSGIRCIFTPGIQDDFFSGSRILHVPNSIYLQGFTLKMANNRKKLNFV